jgi:hypothetical protein
MNVTRSLVLLAAASLSTAAFADDVGARNKTVRNADQKFRMLDRNEDSQISLDEASKDKQLTATFAAADADGDGYLSKPEFTAQLSDNRPQHAPDRSDY